MTITLITACLIALISLVHWGGFREWLSTLRGVQGSLDYEPRRVRRDAVRRQP